MRLRQRPGLRACACLSGCVGSRRRRERVPGALASWAREDLCAGRAGCRSGWSGWERGRPIGLSRTREDVGHRISAYGACDDGTPGMNARLGWLGRRAGALRAVPKRLCRMTAWWREHGPADTSLGPAGLCVVGPAPPVKQSPGGEGRLRC